MKTKYIADITIEAKTPLKVGSNSSDFLQDAPVQKDWNGLPMILGTSIAGVLRKEFDEDKANQIFGYQKQKNEDGEGSKVIFSNALLVDEQDKVCEELLVSKSDFQKIFDELPIREHTSITDKGVAKEHSKFDEEIVYKGTRFRFSIEMLEDKSSFDEILNLLKSSTFRLGSGSSKGFGKFEVKEIKILVVDSVDKLVEYSSSLNNFDGAGDSLEKQSSKKHTKYILEIEPDDFFMLGSGFGDGDADMTPVYEKVVDYKNGRLSDDMILIPASSIKGALSHRVAYYHNKYLLQNDQDHTKVGEDNEAVKAIFGHKKELAKDKKTELGQKGKILISDCYKPKVDNTKVFDHVAIDRFTGGAIDGALFQEKTIAQKDKWEIEIYLENGVDKKYIDSFEKALKDICKGMLPLGGATTKGHGVFQGKLIKDKDGEVLDV